MSNLVPATSKAHMKAKVVRLSTGLTVEYTDCGRYCGARCPWIVFTKPKRKRIHEPGICRLFSTSISAYGTMPLRTMACTQLTVAMESGPPNDYRRFIDGQIDADPYDESAHFRGYWSH